MSNVSCPLPTYVSLCCLPLFPISPRSIFCVRPLSLLCPSSIIIIAFLFLPSLPTLPSPPFSPKVLELCDPPFVLPSRVDLNLNIQGADCFSSPGSPHFPQLFIIFLSILSFMLTTRLRLIYHRTIGLHTFTHLSLCILHRCTLHNTYFVESSSLRKPTTATFKLPCNLKSPC